MRTLITAAFVGSLIGLATQHGSATLLVYEGFNYSAGTSITGQNGGIGWTNAWATGGGTVYGTNVSGNLSYTDLNGVQLQASGGSLQVGSPAGNLGTTASPNRPIPGNLSGGTGTIAGPGATTWISFLYQRLNFDVGTLPGYRQANLGFFEGGGERADVGAPNTSASIAHVMSVWGNGSPHTVAAPFQANDYPITPGSTYFVLLKVVTDNTIGADTMYVWFNWTNLLIEPDVSSAVIVQNEANLSSVNTLRFQAGNLNAAIGSNAWFQVDELRAGTTFSDVAPAFVASQPPSITLQPGDKTVGVGQLVTFSLTAAGDPPLFYQWYFKTNTVLLNQTNSALTIPSVSTNDAGGYICIVTNFSGSVTSLVATLTVLPPDPPQITVQPVNLTNIVGMNANFSAAATGTAPLRYQWHFNSLTLLTNQTNAALSFPITSTNDAGNYSVIVTNFYGSATSSVASLTVIPGSPAGLPAFSGADGAAKFVSGGRGGIVYHVTKLDRNLNDASAGTLRYGLTDGNFPPGVPRTIVFDVAGTFWLGRYGAESNHMHGWDTSSRYNISGNTTVAGQTAPGPVIIAGGVTKPGSSNIILRNVMFAPSYGTRNFQNDPSIAPTPGTFPDSYVFDALDVSGQNVMLDHLTCIYGTDETISCNELANNLTIQYCTMAQGENYPQADAENPGVYGGHALGSLLQAGSNAKISVIHNLYAHLKGRLPRVGSEVGTGAINDFRNNVFYNWFSTAGYGVTTQPSFNNFINNYYIAGPGGNDVSGTNITTGIPGGTGVFNGASSTMTRAYVSGNVEDANIDGDPFDTALADGSFVLVGLQSAAYDVNIGVTLSSSGCLTNVLRYTGSRWWTRPYDCIQGNTGVIVTNDIATYVDERLIKETFTGTGQIISWADDPFDNNPDEGREWKDLLALRADLNTFAAPFNRPTGWDSDDDGMPDAWEIARGLDPYTANNNGDFDNDGYTDLEEYLDELAVWPAPGEILFTSDSSSRFASIFNWKVTGTTVNVAGSNTITSSLWQPSRFDTAVINARTALVDSVGQVAGNIRVENSGALNVTNGWLNVASNLLIDATSTLAISSGELRVTNNLINSGRLRLTSNASLNVTGTFTNTGTLDVMTWNGILPAGFVNAGTILDRSSIILTALGFSGTNFTTTIQGYTGHNYQLQYRDDLSSGAWQNVSNAIPGSNAPIVFSHTGNVTVQQRFYRVAVSP